MLSMYLSFCLWSFTFSLVTAQYLPNTQNLTIKELEHLYLDAAPSGLLSAISPCSNYFDPTTGASSNSLGRQSAAEWIRVAFHDFVTANIYTQSGGLDASIGFETARVENVGSAFNDALTFFSFFFNQKVSMSDLIALGTVMATGACGGPHVVFRAGRVDATAAGPTGRIHHILLDYGLFKLSNNTLADMQISPGVPEPETDLKTTLNQFGNAGFNTDDTIALTACGHSIGGVHKSTFPQVDTSDSPGTLDGSDGRIAFDETVDSFDVSTVTDYVQSTGDKGGPLVTTTNVTVQSDLRLYESDQNATMERLSQSNSYFASQCSSLFQRMIETVPSGVRFISPAVDPTTSTNLKPFGVTLNVDWTGSMTLSGSFRYVQVAGAAAAPDTLTIALISRAGTTTDTTSTAEISATDTGTGIWGPTHSYAFNLTFSADTGLSGVTAGGKTFSFQDTMFVVPALSSVSPDLPDFSTSPSMNTVATYTRNITVAYLTTAPPTSLTATLATPQTQTGTVSPKIGTSTSTLDLIGNSNGYAFYSALITQDVSAKQAYGTSVDVATTAGGTPGVMFYKPFVANA